MLEREWSKAIDVGVHIHYVHKNFDELRHSSGLLLEINDAGTVRNFDFMVCLLT